MKFHIQVDGQDFEVEIRDVNARPITVMVDGEAFEVMPQDITALAAPPTTATAPQPSKPAAARPTASSNGHSASTVYAPIPGVINAIEVKPGEMVSAGQSLCILEAMKMKNIIRANRAGCIGDVLVTVGQQVKHHEVLMTYTDERAAS